jgi:chemosensory pili system protein ChpA (sensor histidine kinase/response regulator)
MLPEQQQRIMGYFIEEAKDHLNTIEQGLLNLQATIEDPELVNEVFRAAHSVKGGAAMLGLTSIQQTAHRLEDSFKILKECSVKVDQQLESLFLRIFDTLQALLEQLGGPFGLTEELAEQMVREVEPIFEELNGHLGGLVGKYSLDGDESGPLPVIYNLQAANGAGALASSKTFAPAVSSSWAAAEPEESALELVFQSDVPARMREMLEAFKQAEGPASRRQLNSICRNLKMAGEEFDLPNWTELIEAVEKAIANPENTYRSLAPIVIKDLKQAQELVLSSQEAEIAVGAKLRAMLPASFASETDFEDLLAFASSTGAKGANLNGAADAAWDLTGTGDSGAVEQLLPTISGLSIDELFDKLDTGDSSPDSARSPQFDDSPGFGESDTETGASRSSTRTGPEVGAAELNTLADLFEGDTPDLDDAWEAEDDGEDGGAPAAASRAAGGTVESDDDDNSGDFTDLLFDAYSSETNDPQAVPPIDDLTNLFGEDFLLSPEGSTGVQEEHPEAPSARKRLTRKQPETTNARPPQEGSDRTSDPLHGGPQADALGTLLDEVAAQTSSPAESSSTFDLLGELDGEAQFTEVSADAPDLTADLDSFDTESFGFEEVAGDSQNYSGDAEIFDRSASGEDGDSAPDGEDEADLSDLLTIASGFLTRADLQGESANDRDSWASNKQHEETSTSLNMTSDSDLDISSDENWLENAFGLEDEDSPLANLELEDTDLEALFGDVSDYPLASSSETQKDRTSAAAAAATSREAADLADLFESVSTGGEFDFKGEAGEETADWLNFESDLESPAADRPASGELASLLASASVLPVSDGDGANLAAAVAVNKSNGSFGHAGTAPTSSTVRTGGGSSDLDLLEDMFGEESDSAGAGGSSGEVREMPGELDVPLFEDSDLLGGLETDGSGAGDESAADLFEGLDSNVFDRGSEEMPAELADSLFDSDADLLAALETEATLGSEDLFGFDDLLDSMDAEALVTSELTTGSWDGDSEPGESDSVQLEEVGLSDFFNDEESPEAAEAGDFDDLEALLVAGGASAGAASGATAAQNPVNSEVFSDLEQLLSQSETVPEIQGQPALAASPAPAAATGEGDDEFGDLEKLLEDSKDGGGRGGEANMGQSGINRARRNVRAGGFGDQTMRVPVKQLDNLSNLMGELVVNRNSLEQDQERMRQFLDNLLHQVALLSDVSQRTQDFYERSLLEIALLANRQGNRPVWRSEESSHQRDSAWRPEEMDRFTPFHSLAQEIIELIVRVRESAADIEFLVDEADQVTRQLRQVTTQLQEGLTRARMKPFAETTDRLFRAVREIAIKCGKQAQLQVEGKDILIDKMIVDQLYDPMTHLVNNAITHGIEPPEVRQAAGKPPTGRITIRAFHQGNQTVISVSDDGAGIDPQKVKARAIKQGLLTAAQAQRMSRPEVYDLLFLPGFSTQEQATEYAGRGVGMDVVRTSLQEIRGAVSIDSTIGKGTVFTIRLPLVLSISKALCCISDRARIAFPMDGVEDMIDVPREQVTTGADGLPCIDWRGTILPFRPLRDLLAYNRYLGRGSVYVGFNAEDDLISVIVLRSSGNFLAVQVDQVSTEQEIVIKQLEGPVPKPIGIAGATVLGDGRIVAIADVMELIDLATGRLRKDTGGTLWDESGDRVAAEAADEKNEPTVLIVDDSITVRSLLSITFEKAGYRVEEARDGKEAWEKMKSGLPCDIVFCDIEMPRMDGLELLSRMQKDSVLCELPIAMLTSRGADRHRQMAYSLGAKGYFTKPYLEEQLMDAASRMLKGEVVGAPAVV